MPNHGELKMNVLVIEDLSVEEEMDRTAMADVSGGKLPQEFNALINWVAGYTHPDTPFKIIYPE
jgi:hypothetical protein